MLNNHMTPRIACEPERPPVGTYWGSINYVVDGYYLALCNDGGTPRSLGAKFDDYDAACVACEENQVVVMATRYAA